MARNESEQSARKFTDEDRAAAALAAGAKQENDARNAAIEKWFGETFNGSVVAQNTECYNHVRRGVDELKRLLATT